MNKEHTDLNLIYERLPKDGHRLLYYRLHLLVSRQWHAEWEAKRNLYPHEEANQAFRKIEMISFDRKDESPTCSPIELRKYHKPEPGSYSVMTNLSVPSTKEAEDIAKQWANIFNTFYQDTHYDIITTERRNDVASQKTTGLSIDKENQILKKLFEDLDKIEHECYHHFQLFRARHYEREFFLFVQQGVPIEKDNAASIAFKAWTHQYCGGWEFTPKPFQRGMFLIDNLPLQRLKQFSQIVQGSTSQRTKV